MNYPTLRPVAQSRQMLSTFLGLDRSDRPAEGAFIHMENLSSDCFPVLSPRKQRTVHTQGLTLGIIGADILTQGADGVIYPGLALCYADAKTRRLVVDGQTTALTISPTTQKWMVRMGAYVLVFPDKKYLNTLDLTDYGSMEVIHSLEQDLTLTPCGPDGGEGDGCIKLSAPGIGSKLAVGDGVTLEGFTVAPLNGIAVLRAVDTDYIVIDGTLEGQLTQPATVASPVEVARRVPDMDFVVECGNRLWGCRYGLDQDGEMINQLYCCKLGDFKNWSVYQGLSTDAWAASVGSDGPFTGAISHLGHPLFFKENCLHKVHISATGGHQIVDTVCRGVQLGCGKSLAVVGETLYYKSTGGVMAYDGAFPTAVGEELGDLRYSAPGNSSAIMHNGQRICGVGGSTGSKYYLSVTDTAGNNHLLVYDTVRHLWHREDDLRLSHICALGQQLYGVERGGNILLLNSREPIDETVSWQATTGELGLESPDQKYISRLTLRLSMDPGSRLWVDARYDHSQVWHRLCEVQGQRLSSYPVTVLPRRCDHLQLRFSGCGDVKLYSLTKTVTEGSDIG